MYVCKHHTCTSNYVHIHDNNWMPSYKDSVYVRSPIMHGRCYGSAVCLNMSLTIKLCSYKQYWLVNIKHVRTSHCHVNVYK